MSAVQKVFELTEQLFKLVEKPIAKDNREEVIELITSLLDGRDTFLSQIKPPFTIEEKLKAEQMMNWNERITAEFQNIKMQVQQDITKLKKTKTKTNMYVNPYQSVSTTDGMFYDKRK